MCESVVHWKPNIRTKRMTKRSEFISCDQKFNPFFFSLFLRLFGKLNEQYFLLGESDLFFFLRLFLSTSVYVPRSQLILCQLTIVTHVHRQCLSISLTKQTKQNNSIRKQFYVSAAKMSGESVSKLKFYEKGTVMVCKHSLKCSVSMICWLFGCSRQSEDFGRNITHHIDVRAC